MATALALSLTGAGGGYERAITQGVALASILLQGPIARRVLRRRG